MDTILRAAQLIGEEPGSDVVQQLLFQTVKIKPSNRYVLIRLRAESVNLFLIRKNCLTVFRS